MTLTQLRYAITISEIGSFNKAAQILYVSQPSLSNAIHDLEDEFLVVAALFRGQVADVLNARCFDLRKAVAGVDAFDLAEH